MLYRIGKFFGRIIGTIYGFIFGRSFIRICKMFGWEGDDIRDFGKAIQWQIKHGRFWVPDEKEEDEA